MFFEIMDFNLIKSLWLLISIIIIVNSALFFEVFESKLLYIFRAIRDYFGDKIGE